MKSLLSVFALVGALLAVSLPAYASAPTEGGAKAGAAAAKRCNISGRERKLGATYVTSLTVRGTSCAAAEKLVKAFHRCRRSAGGADGRCKRRVLRYSCTERRGQAIQTQYDSTVTCRKGGARVVHRYTQYT